VLVIGSQQDRDRADPSKPAKRTNRECLQELRDMMGQKPHKKRPRELLERELKIRNWAGQKPHRKQE
jgi:hypothetical protein